MLGNVIKGLGTGIGRVAQGAGKAALHVGAEGVKHVAEASGIPQMVRSFSLKEVAGSVNPLFGKLYEMSSDMLGKGFDKLKELRKGDAQEEKTLERVENNTTVQSETLVNQQGILEEIRDGVHETASSVRALLPKTEETTKAVQLIVPDTIKHEKEKKFEQTEQLAEESKKKDEKKGLFDFSWLKKLKIWGSLLKFVAIIKGVGKFVRGIVSLVRVAVIGIGAVIETIFSPVGAVIAGLVASAAALWAIFTNKDVIMDFLGRVKDSIIDSAAGAWDWILEKVKPVTDIITSISDAIQTTFQNALSSVQKVVNSIINWMYSNPVLKHILPARDKVTTINNTTRSTTQSDKLSSMVKDTQKNSKQLTVITNTQKQIAEDEKKEKKKAQPTSNNVSVGVNNSRVNNTNVSSQSVRAGDVAAVLAGRPYTQMVGFE